MPLSVLKMSDPLTARNGRTGLGVGAVRRPRPRGDGSLPPGAAAGRSGNYTTGLHQLERGYCGTCSSQILET